MGAMGGGMIPTMGSQNNAAPMPDRRRAYEAPERDPVDLERTELTAKASGYGQQPVVQQQQQQPAAQKAPPQVAQNPQQVALKDLQKGKV